MQPSIALVNVDLDLVDVGPLIHVNLVNIFRQCLLELSELSKLSDLLSGHLTASDSRREETLSGTVGHCRTTVGHCRTVGLSELSDTVGLLSGTVGQFGWVLGWSDWGRTSVASKEG